jgi:hypothetical protein
MISSCSYTSSRIDTLWENSEYKDAKMDTILVIGITKDEYQRKGFELYMKKELEKRGIKAYESLDILPKDVKITKENFYSFFKNYNLDGVITVKVVGKDIKKIDAYNVNYNNPTGFFTYFYNSYDLTYATFQVREKVIKIEANLFDTKTAKMVWSGLSQTTDYSKASEIIIPLTKEIAEKLSDLGFIK